ncbi:Tc5 transposase DNA-binding domain [Popillia japonica]|uniref:Tc5 transposase DNA-binding domain n=1 Tax=Popillia japonica TaxID=7064 RepID=A0AAW1MYP2_POPJA
MESRVVGQKSYFFTWTEDEANRGTSTIRDIKAKRVQLEQFASKLDSEEGTLKRKTARPTNNKALEDAMYIWFTQSRSLGEPISGPLICEKGLQFNEQLNGPKDFKASSGWLKDFKNRHGIRELDVQEEKLSSDLAAGIAYKGKFVKEALKNCYSRDDIYNADTDAETGINWRALPRKSLASRRDKPASGFKCHFSHVTSLQLCSQFVKKVNLKDCIYMLADAWESLTETNLQRAWGKLWPYDKGTDDDEEEEAGIDGAVNEIRDICSTLPGFEQCDKDDAMEWLGVDSNDPGYQILTDQEIADMLNDEDTDTIGSEGDDAENGTEKTGPTHSDAFVAAVTLMLTTQKMGLKKQGQHILMRLWQQ